MLSNKQAASTLPSNAFAIKNDLTGIFLCVYFGLEACIIVAVLVKRVGLIGTVAYTSKYFRGNNIRKVKNHCSKGKIAFRTIFILHLEAK